MGPGQGAQVAVYIKLGTGVGAGFAWVVIGGERAARATSCSRRKALARDAQPFAGAHVAVRKGHLGDRAVALGAIATVLQATTRFAGVRSAASAAARS